MPEEELNHSPEGEALKVRMAELEGLVATKDEALKARDARLSQAEARITELEQGMAERDSELAKSAETLSTLKNSLAQAVASYRAQVVKANPDILPELITGDSLEAIDQSLASARALIFRVKQGLEAEVAKSRVPAGAPQRTMPDLSVLSPREKIQYAIGRKS